MIARFGEAGRLLWKYLGLLSALIMDCTLDVVYGLIQIVMFLFYWEALQEEKAGPVEAPVPA